MTENLLFIIIISGIIKKMLEKQIA